MSKRRPFVRDATIDNDASTAGIQPEHILRILSLIAEQRLDWVLPAAQALAHRIDKSRFDRANQIAQVLGDMASAAKHRTGCAPATRRRSSPRIDDAPVSPVP